MVPCFDENELVNNLGHLARCRTKAVIEAMSAPISQSWFMFDLFGSSRTLWSASELTTGCTSENRRLVVDTEIDSPLENFVISVKVENFLVRRARVRDDPGRSPQVELDPEKVLMHFPVSLSVSRQAGSSAHRKCARRQSPGTEQEAGAGAHHPPAHAATSLHGLTLCEAAKVSG